MFQIAPFLGQRAKEDVLQKEVRVKILKDSIKLVAAKVPSGGQELTSEFNEVLESYQLLCNRIRGKCHTLEVRACLPQGYHPEIPALLCGFPCLI